MGTRHLICIVVDGEYKLAQYGQWDGYPSGAGHGCLQFLHSLDGLDLLKERARALTSYTSEEIDEIRSRYSKEPTAMSMEEAERLKQDHPELSRDTSSDLLPLILNGSVTKIVSMLDFAADSLFCEWAYVIDLDAEQFEVHQGLNRSALKGEERFAFLSDKAKDGYFPVRLQKSYRLDALPSIEEFCESFEDQD